MEKSNYQLAEMVNSANYASMSYNELVTINFAFHLAIGEVKPLIEKKRAEEMESHTRAYVVIMNNYGASKAEVLSCLEKEVLREVPYGLLKHQDVDDQIQDAVPDEESRNEHVRDENILLLPEHVETLEDNAQGQVVTEFADVNEWTAEEEPKSKDGISAATNNEAFVEEALAIMRKLSVPKDINTNAPYYMECDFSYEEELGHSDPTGRNMRRRELEEFRSASEVYYRVFKKKKIIACTDCCLVYNDSLNSFVVRLYYFPEDIGNVAEYSAQEATLTADEIKNLEKRKSCLSKAIKLAKKHSYSDETDANKPFYDRYLFSARSRNKLELKSDRERFYEDVSDLTELMPAFESYAKLFREGFTVLAKDNCVAAMMYETIYVVLFNFPAQERSRKAAKKPISTSKDVGITKESETVANTSLALSVRDIILKAVEMTKTLPVGNGIDVNAPHFVQQSFGITNEGTLVSVGKTFCKNICMDEIDRYRKEHCRFAKSMKAGSLVSSDDYTAFVEKGGKKLTVFCYNTKG